MQALYWRHKSYSGVEVHQDECSVAAETKRNSSCSWLNIMPGSTQEIKDYLYQWLGEIEINPTDCCKPVRASKCLDCGTPTTLDPNDLCCRKNASHGEKMMDDYGCAYQRSESGCLPCGKCSGCVEDARCGEVANAQLIASAPVLYEALESLLECGRKDLSNPKYDGYFETAKAALLQARGENGENNVDTK